MSRLEDDEIVDHLRQAFAQRVEGVAPTPDLLVDVHRQLRRQRRRTVVVRACSAPVGLAAVLAAVVAATAVAVSGPSVVTAQPTRPRRWAA